MSGYKFVMGFIAIIISAIIWLPLSYAFDLIVVAINSGLTNPDVMERNRIMGQAVYYSLFFVILAVVLYIIKTEKGEEDDSNVVYIPAQVIPPGTRIPSGIGLTLMALFLALALIPGAQAADFSAWTECLDIGISPDLVDATLTNFPVLVILNSTNFDYAEALAGGADIRPVDQPCGIPIANLLPYEIEDWDTGGNSPVHVNLSLSSSTWTNGSIRYGNAGASDAQDPTNVWDNNFLGVWHMADAAGNTSRVPDSTGTYNGSKKGAGDPLTKSSNIGYSQEFDDSGEYIKAKNYNIESATVEVYFNTTSTSTGQYVVSTDDGGANCGDFILFINTVSADKATAYWDRRDACAASDFYISTLSNIAANTDYYAAITMNDTETTFYLDKVLQGTSSAFTELGDNGVSFDPGGSSVSPSEAPLGEIDEVRLSDMVRSPAWINATYFSLRNQLVTYTNYTAPVPPLDNVTLTLGVDPNILYTDTAANFSIQYNESHNYAGNISLNITRDGTSNITGEDIIYFNDTTANSTVYYLLGSGNYSKHQNLTIYVNVTAQVSGETDSANLTREIQNSIPTVPLIILSPVSVIIGDNLTTNSTSTDTDSDSITYWYLFGWDNNTNITDWKSTNNLTITQARENDTIRAWALADDGEVNGSTAYEDMIVSRIVINYPVDEEEYIGKTFEFSFNLTAEQYLNCYELIGYDNLTTYGLGYLYTGEHNNTRTVWYDENNTYIARCYSLEDGSRYYDKTLNFTNYFANWSVSMYTENDWDTPLNITEANLSIFINCEGGSQYVYNFTGTTYYGVKPECDVESITAKVDYTTDSYTRERSTPDCMECDIRMYMVDAMVYTVLQIPIYMSDYNYWDTRIELYKLSGGEHYTIAQGYFDVERKYVTYLTKDNTYYIRLDQGALGNQVRDIGFLYAATATAQYLSLSEINLNPSISLISDNLQFAAAFDNYSANTSTLRITYEDAMNLTTSVRVRIFSLDNTTAWYDNYFYGYDNLTISINDVNTTRQTVHFTVQHAVLGNSPVEFTVAVGSLGMIDFMLPEGLTWLYSVAAFIIIFFTTMIVVPQIRLPGIIIVMAEFGIFFARGWFAGLELASVAFLFAILAGGIVYEIKYKGVT